MTCNKSQCTLYRRIGYIGVETYLEKCKSVQHILNETYRKQCRYSMAHLYVCWGQLYCNKQQDEMKHNSLRIPWSVVCHNVHIVYSTFFCREKCKYILKLAIWSVVDHLWAFLETPLMSHVYFNLHWFALIYTVLASECPSAKLKTYITDQLCFILLLL